ncbi:hypothetical protein BN59_03039 [Legionella massiliensis]|uniref:Periplasmic protein n=1 Tax=Legionella massiliensis TaxID=1034943 RepID=A0A078L0N8_9GAMM|nr:hypothetical protein [Legionella massiliensis]CDZ78726.1 hypothetical protein BN59_03039 [Legionella massiliensis]CEE14464.1 hypothetical protein BN1094_03039 [Legionella massiliensis]
MFSRYSVSLLLVALSSQSFAFQCYITLVKDSCWTNYNVSMAVINSTNNQTITTVEAPKGKQWQRQPFQCEAAMKLMYNASFSPVFWENDKGKSYWALRYWFLPGEVKPNQSAWDIPVCFPSAFSGVPLPPEANGNCKCDFFSIPPVPPAVIKAPSSGTTSTEPSS